MNRPIHAPEARQRGAILVVVLMFLTVLTVLAVAAFSTGAAEEKMARNIRDHNIAFQAAEAALQDARMDLLGQGPTAKRRSIDTTSAFTANCDAGLCTKWDVTKTPYWTDTDSSASKWANGVKYGTYTGRLLVLKTDANALSTGVARKPEYLIEYVSTSGADITYRLTARAWGATARTSDADTAPPPATVMLQEEVVVN
jgi:type IV pilus assembly protein PilX